MTSMRTALRHISRGMILLFFTACLFGSHFPSQLDRIKERGILLAAVKGSQGGEEIAPHLEFDIALLRQFADYLGVDLELVSPANLSQLQFGVAKERFDLGVANSRRHLYPVRQGVPYLFVKEYLIYKKGTEKPKGPEDLVNKSLQVEFGSHHSATLKQLQQNHPELRWDEIAETDNIDLIAKVQNGSLDYAVVDSNIFDISRHLYPEVRIAFDLSNSSEIAWNFSDTADHSLFNAAAAFMQDIYENGKLEQLTAQHYSHIKKMDYTDAVAFYRRVQTRLPQWRDLLLKSAKEHNLDWNLLAAISYQESHWNANAKSYTGVRGLMMLTKTTAREMGIKDRTDPAQSIEGGARYFKSIFKRLPKGIQGDDRTWFALAAYNVGFAHLEDARVLTQRLGGNPNHWEEVRKRLPLLSQKKYYSTLRYGYARGREPVKYVQNIQQYYDILSWQDNIAQSRPEKSESKQVEAVKLQQDERDLNMSLL
ncbi:membrane-bound lytic murein transglycosylase MltF [Pseudoteredinibacter isoporae]|uniref:Membrane-bound lytic murein transglycosylase F n=1 Tax=Pseudoteredinibacter isoporae TaxID=570281 RepID=A0A7X0MWY9_9GAMM|nr:membrane-bound lytic murein transglycosylase MltF [Pseudoteredinibacter isoporae]MBB6523171.1 membrane-bound lytic murein transglycosylase F [Pseudoteredinibacter isoporae]NHO88689.1 membrane-bound lytic murein transglycosylase MltF [Pseudoteredinibacter isoporae]NIB22620.1 membrane-bound lytic murein transglycosylase MltF [Pseudoteredinibacter isoporae]